MKKIITTTYNGPDLDGYGCAVAYAELLRAQGKDAEAHIWGTPHLEVQWTLESFKITPAASPLEDREADLILLDASGPEDVPGTLQVEQVVEIIDHRKLHHADQFPNAKAQIELVGAAATLVAERFKEAGLEPSKESALLLLGGIISNTQNFTGIVTDRDKEMAKWLQEISGAPEDLARQMFLAKSDLPGSKLRETLLGDSKVFYIQGKVVGTAQLEIIGVQQLLQDRRDEIEKVLQEIKVSESCDYTYANMQDLELGKSWLLCVDGKTVELLKDAPDITWKGRLGVSKKLTLRKQMNAWIEEKLRKL